ncbi:MAG: 3-phosphoshikimate 1-carboxyvinyltransferase [Methanospirillaceae archaeon]|nr:3-phosphoshikimate 1-carboxyvinyltransferase [Methanospirillaceae archaeon]
MIARIAKTGPVQGTLRVPPSKSYTHRALIAAALAEGESVIKNPLDSDDTRVTAAALASFGAGIDWREGEIYVRGTAGKLSTPENPVDIKDSGTSMRLLASLALLCEGEVVLTGSHRMQQRPIGPLVDALNQVGGEITYLGEDGYPPLRIAGSFLGGRVSIDPGISSQFVSSMLMAAPCGRSDLILSLRRDPVSAPYIDVTRSVMESFDVTTYASRSGGSGTAELIVPVSSRYRSSHYTVEGDFSAASYWFGLAAICTGEMRVLGLNPKSAQGDRVVLDILSHMGCLCEIKGDACIVRRQAGLQGITVDMGGAPDIVLTIAVVSALAEGKTTITGIAHLRHKESDRIAAICDNITACGGSVCGTDDALVITPGAMHGAVIDPKADHRTAMSFGILGCGTGEMTIRDPGCVSKSYPRFWEELEAVCHQTVLFS